MSSVMVAELATHEHMCRSLMQVDHCVIPVQAFSGLALLYFSLHDLKLPSLHRPHPCKSAATVTSEASTNSCSIMGKAGRRNFKSLKDLYISGFKAIVCHVIRLD
eukprot:TRINITY_DN33262_c0_g1_i1.p2 TRINITY_DN33262_c0_g1~~TRINITY_DN33262_c0_g1_i1.p2  ORF type:complete len:105 (+),score=9.95 TRINITY_DN33262_c0_g1_i1:397-711(+)